MTPGVSRPALTVVGAGLAGCEAAWQAARLGVSVTLCEMRPRRMTPAHRTDAPAELVCSNSLGSQLPDRATGLLLAELDAAGALLPRLARETAVPAGGALAVDRAAFSAAVARELAAQPNIRLRREEIVALPAPPAVLATGPLTSPALSEALREHSGIGNLFFYDAIAPVVAADSLDETIVFRASRYDRGAVAEGDYLNCPMDRGEYDRFVAALVGAERIPLPDFDRAVESGVQAGPGPFFEGCLPIEILARRDPLAAAFGPMRPVGLRDPRTGRRPYAVVQLRIENRAGDEYNLVGFQTNLRQAEQERVFRLIPGLARARFVRYGQMHRNTFLCAPRLLDATLEWRDRSGLFVAGQLAGVEGYLGNIASGWLAGRNAARRALGGAPVSPPPETMLGALCRALAQGDPDRFQPVKANLGLLPPLAETARGKRARAAAHAARAGAAMRAWLDESRAPDSQAEGQRCQALFSA